MSATTNRAMTLTVAAAAAMISLTIAEPDALADQASAHYHNAMALKRAGNFTRAIKELQQAISVREDYAAAHYSIGILYRKKSNHHKAVSHLERAAALDGKNGQILYSLGLAYYHAGRKDDALRTLEKAARLKPKDDQINAQVGVLYIRKDLNKAISFLKKAVAAKPNHADHEHQLGLAYRKATAKMTGPAMDKKRKKYLRMAAMWLNKAAKKKDDAGLEFDLGVLYRRLERTDMAIAHYESAVKLNPRLTPAWWDLAHMYTRAKRYDEAVTAYKKYLRYGGKDRAIANKRIKDLSKR